MEKLTGIFKSEKGIKIIFAAGIALIIIIFLFSLSDGGSKTRESAGSENENVLSEIEMYERKLEQRLTEIIGEIQGTADIHIMITLEKTEENLYGGKTSDISATITPRVKGAVIVCKGSENAVIRQKVVDAACKALGVSAARICVTY